MGFFSGLFGAWSSLRAFNGLPAKDREIVFYAEGRADWPHLGPIVEQLTGALGMKLCYVTSEEDDPELSAGRPGVRAFYMGSGAARTAFFKGVESKVIVMTLPDLESFHLKRSVHPAHYVYVFHAALSSHMVYRKGAFDAYDTVFCVGPHHAAELRRAEEVFGTPAKRLVEHGYGRLDRILEASPEVPGGGPGPRRVLLASGWGECSIIEDPRGPELIRHLLSAGHAVTVRLHPMTVRRRPRLAGELSGAFRGEAGFAVETDMNSRDSLRACHLMISDWSGAALDYAFGLERPVLFVDMPRKVNNPEYERLGLPPLEVSLRSELGGVLDPRDLARAPARVEALAADAEGFRARLREARRRWIFNVGRSGAVGATEVARLAGAARA